MHDFVIATPTDLDVREVVTLGLTSKQDGSKIGHKGSGLKFTLAFLHRLGGWLEIIHPQYHLKSKTVTATVRGQEHRFVVLEDQRGSNHIETHLTELAGADTWKEPWFILRELMQNALDEGGTVLVSAAVPSGTRTIIRVPLLDPLARAWKERQRWYLPRQGRVVCPNAGTTGVFFHGFKVYEPREKWYAAYDVTDVLKRDQLSEDRQLRNIDLHSLFTEIACEGNFPDEAIKLYLQEPTQDLSLLFEGVWNHISDSKTAWGGVEGFSLERLESAFLRQHGERAVYGENLQHNVTAAYYARSAGFRPVEVRYDLSRLLRYSKKILPVHQCLPTLRERLVPLKTAELSEMEKLRAAMRLTRKLRPAGTKIQLVDKKVLDDKVDCKALAVPTENKVLVLRNALQLDLPDLAKLLIEEYAHLRSGAKDFSQEMQEELVTMLYELLAKRKQSAGNL